MGDCTNNNPLQDILDKLHCIRTREQELIVQLSAILGTGAENDPAPPRSFVLETNLLNQGYAFVYELIHRYCAFA